MSAIPEAASLVNAIAALERASGVLEGLERNEDAFRCTDAATELRAYLTTLLVVIVDVEPSEGLD